MSEKRSLRSTDIIIYCGTAEEGKSTLMKHDAKQVRGRRIIWDYNREHRDMGRVVHWLDGENSLEKEFEHLKHIVFQPLDKSPEYFRKFMRTCNVLSRYYCFVLIIEEVEVYAEPSNCNLYKKQRDLADLADNGRHRGVGVWMTCSNIHTLSKKLTFRASHIFAFRQHRPQDVEYLERWIGPKANMLSPAKAQKKKMEYIKKYHYLHFNKVKTVVRRPV